MEVFTFDLSHASMSDKAHRGGRGAEPADIRNLSPKDTGLEALSEVTIVSCKIGLELSSGAFPLQLSRTFRISFRRQEAAAELSKPD